MGNLRNHSNVVKDGKQRVYTGMPHKHGGTIQSVISKKNKQTKTSVYFV